LAVTFIPLTGSRTKDNYLAFACASAGDAAKFSEDLWLGDWRNVADDLGRAAAKATGLALGSFGNLSGISWHHSEIMGIMEFMQTDKHRETHTGAVALWKIIHGKETYDT
jgi:hypothetical protein